MDVAFGDVEDGIDIDAEEAGDILPLADAEDVVDGGRLFLDLAAIGLGHAPGDDEGLALALGGGEFADGRHRLFLALFDKAAGVDDDRIGVPGLEDGQEFAAGEEPFEVFAIDVVLGAAEGDQVVGLRDCHQGPSLMTMRMVEPAAYSTSGAGDWLTTVPFGWLFCSRSSWTT